MSRHATELSKVPKLWREEAGELEKTVWFLNFSPYTEAISWSKIVKETERDDSLQRLEGHIRKGYILTKANDWKPYRNIFDSLTISDVGLVLKDERVVLHVLSRSWLG